MMEALTFVRPRDCDFAIEVPTRNRSWYAVDGYEPYTTTLFRASCTRADVILDIGAHVGYFAVVGARANPAARVIAVEASPQNCAVLSRNLEAARPSTVEVFCAAFGDSEGTAWLDVTEASDNCGLTGHPNSPTVERVRVRAITGSALNVPPGSRVVVKIDIEGHELRALDGLARVLSDCPDARLFVELNPKCLRHAGQAPDAVLAWLLSHKFRVFALDERSVTWSELRTPGSWASIVDEASYANLYCLPAEPTRTVSAVLHSSALTGSDRSHVEMVRDLIVAGFMIHTIVPQPDLGVADEARRAGSSVFPVVTMAWWMTPLDAPPEDGARPRWIHAPLVDELARVNADIVLTQTGVIPQGAIAASILDVPHVWYLREFGDVDHALRLPAPAIEFGRLVRGLSDAVITNSSAVREHFFPGDPDAATVIYPAPSVTPRTDLTRLRRRRWTLGIVGSLQPGKGHAEALAAVADLRRRGLRVPLVFRGSGSAADRTRLSALARDLGVADLITFAGAVDDLAAVYDGMDAVAVTSRSEAFGRVPFEATAAGLPVIYASAGGLLEYMYPGVTGLAYTPGDSHALATAIQTLAGDGELQQALVAGARRELAEFSRQQARRAELERVLRTVSPRRRTSLLQALIHAIGTSPSSTRERDEALAERDEAIARARAIESSRIWRYTGWYRAARARLRRGVPRGVRAAVTPARSRSDTERR
jgi:FkbM family methyltransferase